MRILPILTVVLALALHPACAEHRVQDPAAPTANTETRSDAPLPGAAVEADVETPSTVEAATLEETSDALEPGQDGKVALSDAEWRQRLDNDRFHILREKGTEWAFTGDYYDTKTPGTYECAGCRQELFSSNEKYDSGCGWPSFWQPIESSAVDEHEDKTHGMLRTEVVCSRCDGHLGHVFTDGPKPTGLRYCINSASLILVPRD